MTDATTEAVNKSVLTDEDSELLTKLCEQVWFVYRTTGSTILLTTHQELTDLRTRITGEDN